MNLNNVNQYKRSGLDVSIFDLKKDYIQFRFIINSIRIPGFFGLKC